MGIVFEPSGEERKDEKVDCDQFGYSTVKTFCVVIFCSECADNDIDDDGAKLLSEALKVNTTLSAIYLGR